MSVERALAEALTAAVVVGPEDQLVLVMEDLTHADRDRILASLAETPLAGRVLVVGGRAELAVLRGGS